MMLWLRKHADEIRLWGLMLATYGLVTKTPPLSTLVHRHWHRFDDSLCFLGAALSRFGSRVFRPVLALALGVIVADVFRLQGIAAVACLLPGIIALLIVGGKLWKTRPKKSVIPGF